MLNNKKLKTILVLFITLLFVGCNNDQKVTKELDDEEDIFAVMKVLEVTTGQVLLRNNKNFKDMATWTLAKPFNRYLEDETLKREARIYIPKNLPDGFEYFSDYTISSLYLSEGSVDLSKEPIATHYDGRYLVYNAEESYDNKIKNFIYYASPTDEDLKYQSISFDHNLYELDDNYDLDYLLKENIIVGENEILENYSLTEIESDLFEKTYYLEAEEKGHDKNKFIRVYGINPIDAIKYYNFENNDTPITNDNLNEFIKEYNYEVFALGFTEFKEGKKVKGEALSKEDMLKIMNNLEIHE